MHIPFQKTIVFFFFFFGFFNKDYTFYTKNLFFSNERCPKFCKNNFFINIFTFLSVIRPNFEYNLRTLANFRLNTQKSTEFAFAFLKKLVLFWIFFNKNYTFYTKNYFFYNERCPNFRKNQFFSNIFTFLSVICRNFKYNQRILANFRVNTQKSTEFAFAFSKNYSFFGFFNKGYTFYTKNLFFYNDICPKL